MTIGMGDKEKSMGNRTLKHMVLENLALWKERYLLDEQGDQEKGYMGYVKGVFENEVRRMDNVAWMRKVDDTTAFHDEFESLFHFLESKAAGYMLRSLADTSAFCKNKLHNHIPYSFNRECWAWRALTESFVWYIALTPWNTKHHFMIYCYHRKMLMEALAKEKGLPEMCFCVLKYTGEVILVRYGASEYVLLSQYGKNALENRSIVRAQNEAMRLTPAQIAAMENGVIYGWDFPIANPANYDDEGHYNTSDGQEMGEK